jgi:drug/metabolite transporter (DMT)-like permease
MSEQGVRGRRGPAAARNYALYAAMTSIWGASFFFTAIALRSFNPFMVVLVRMALGAAALGVVVRVRRAALPRDGRVLRHLLVLGAFNIALPFTLLTLAQVHVTSSVAVVLSATTPVFVFLIASLVTRAERFSGRRLAGIVTAFGGMAVLSGLNGSGTGWGWPLLVVLSSAIFAGGNVYTRRHLPHLDPAVIACCQVTAGALWLLPVTALTGNLTVSAPDPLSALALLELGLLGSGAAYLLFFRFILLWGSTAASVNTYLQPVVGLLLSVLLLDEAMSGRHWAALGAILLGILIFGLSRDREPTR